MSKSIPLSLILNEIKPVQTHATFFEINFNRFMPKLSTRSLSYILNSVFFNGITFSAASTYVLIVRSNEGLAAQLGRLGSCSGFQTGSTKAPSSFIHSVLSVILF